LVGADIILQDGTLEKGGAILEHGQKEYAKSLEETGCVMKKPFIGPLRWIAD